MAIQKINLGTEPLGEGGDTYRSANTKINENFTNTAHAASRLVGTTFGNVVEVGGFGVGDTTLFMREPLQIAKGYPPTGVFRISEEDLKGGHPNNMTGLVWSWASDGVGASIKAILASRESTSDLYYYSWSGSAKTLQVATKIYTEANTTKDTATGFLKVSSPVLHVYNDSITKIHEAEQLDITVDKKGVGHYEIHGTTGLRKNDGWFMSPPRDMHSNVLCMVDYEEKDGVIILKTYKKKFDFETVSIVHDYENPMDIPDGVCVEFRFNDLPQEDSGDFVTPEVK